MTGYIFLLIMVLLTGSAQFLIKKGSQQLSINEGIRRFVVSLFSKHVLLGGMLTLMAPIFYILALRTVPLSTAYIFSSLNVVIVTLIGHLAFQEPLPRIQILGVILIVSGILCFAL